MTKIFKVIATGVTVVLGGCNADVSQYAQTKPAMSMEAFFNGPIKGWGIVQDRKGQVLRRFDVEMQGSWQGDKGELREKFAYYDGEQQQRVWTITRTGDGLYSGAADDIIGNAEGQVSGNAVRWSYKMDLEVDGSTYRITFDDWMFLMNDDVLINKSYLKKFGFKVAELTLFMQKQPESE